MKKILFVAIILPLFLAGLSNGQTEAANPNEAANKMFVEVVKLISDAKGKPSKQVIKDLKKAITTLKQIVEKYPSSNLAVQIISGQSIGNISLSKIEKRLRDFDGRLGEKTYGGKFTDVANALAVLPNGDMIMAGYTESKGAGKFDAWVIRLASDGKVIWEKTLGSKYSDFANAIAVLPNGDFVMAGGAGQSDAGQSAWVVRMAGNGNVIWDKRFAGNGNAGAGEIALLPNGDILASGRTWPKGEGLAPWAVRLNGNGDVIWERVFGKNSHDRRYTNTYERKTLSDERKALSELFSEMVFDNNTRDGALASFPNGDIVVAGTLGWMSRLSGDGKKIWEKKPGSEMSEVWYDLEVLPNGDIVATGYVNLKGTDDTVAIVVRLDGDGNVIWERKFTGSNNVLAAIALLPNGDLIIAGYIQSEIKRNFYAWAIRMDGNGKVIWDKTFGGEADVRALALTLLPNGDLVMVGRIDSAGVGGTDTWIFQLSAADGQLVGPGRKRKAIYGVNDNLLVGKTAIISECRKSQLSQSACECRFDLMKSKMSKDHFRMVLSLVSGRGIIESERYLRNLSPKDQAKFSANMKKIREAAKSQCGLVK